MKRFKGKSVIVTGGAGGIGEAVCIRFAAEGGKVWIIDTNTEAGVALAGSIDAAGGSVRFLEAFRTFWLVPPVEMRTLMEEIRTIEDATLQS